MIIKRFFGKNSREALKMVREKLGENAIILSNKAVDGGNEIMAFKEEDMNAMVAKDEPMDASALLALMNKANFNQAANMTENQALPASSLAVIHEFDETIKRAELKNNATKKRAEMQKNTSSTSAPRQLEKQTNNEQSSTQMNQMMNEMREMRSVIESQLTTLAWGNIQQRDPVKSKMLNMLLSAGFSAALSRQLSEKIPANLSEEKARSWISSVLSINLNTIENDTKILDRGGIFALIGPTGVGKTTTTAKLAARYVMKHGTQSLGLITTDAYRIGGHEQLRIYGKILGVMVHAVKDEADLKIALNELKNKHTILIDTVGVSQRDRMVQEQIAMLSSTSMPVKKLLCLNATSTGETLADVIKAYKRNGLDGSIITKLDEAAAIGSAIDVVIREKLKLYYVTNGQRVPEDIHVAKKSFLIHHALKSRAENNQAFQFMTEELPFLMGNTAFNNQHQFASAHDD